MKIDRHGVELPLGLWLVVLAIVVAAAVLARTWISASAQQLDPLATVQAYTTADPNNPDRFGLATPDGRYSVTPIQGCDWLSVGQEVLTYPNWQMPPWLGISGTDAAQPGCAVRVEGRMDNTPCFINNAGVCDVSAEFDAE